MRFADSSPVTDSPFSPPRAGRGAAFWRAWFALRRRGRLGDLRVPPILARLRGATVPWPLFGVVCIPSLGLHLLPNPLWRRAGLALFWTALFVAVVEYARPAGAAAFGLAAAAHGIGAAAFRDSASPLEGYRRRLVRRLGIVGAAALIFTPLASSVSSRFVIAVATKDGPILVNPAAASSPPRYGELVAYRLADRYDNGLRVIGGVYFGRVLASVPGQTLSFQPGHYTIDGARYPALPNMPQGGSFQLEAAQAFVWPETLHFRTDARDLPGHIGVVGHSALVGRPYTRWFWRKQTTAP